MRHPIIFVVLLVVAPFTAVGYFIVHIILGIRDALRRQPGGTGREPTTAQRLEFEADLAAHSRRLDEHGPTIPLPKELRT